MQCFPLQSNAVYIIFIVEIYIYTLSYLLMIFSNYGRLNQGADTFLRRCCFWHSESTVQPLWLTGWQFNWQIDKWKLLSLQQQTKCFLTRQPGGLCVPYVKFLHLQGEHLAQWLSVVARIPGISLNSCHKAESLTEGLSIWWQMAAGI